jgi:formyltetrahydrofolate deformylase
MTIAPATATSALPHAAPAAPRDPGLGRLHIRCQDQPGIVSAVSSFLAQAGANIVALDQHSTVAEGGAFFQRTEFHLPGLPAARDELARSFAGLAQCFDMDFQFSEAAKPKRVAIMVSRRTTACSICCGATAGANSTCRCSW